MSESKTKCPYCNGTGEHDGEICLCVWSIRDQDDLPEAFVDLFGDVIVEKKKAKRGN